MAVDGRLDFINKEMWVLESDLVISMLTSDQKKDREANQRCAGKEWPVENTSKPLSLRIVMIDWYRSRSYRYSLKLNHRLQKLKRRKKFWFDGMAGVQELHCMAWRKWKGISGRKSSNFNGSKLFLLYGCSWHVVPRVPFWVRLVSSSKPLCGAGLFRFFAFYYRIESICLIPDGFAPVLEI